MAPSVRHIPLYYDNADSRNSALRLILTLRPDWEESKDTIEFIRFTDGITNTLLKAVNKIPGSTPHELDQEAILLRAYGRGTDVLIDRNRECASHSLLSSYNLAPPLLARFDNGLLYKYIEGFVCSPADLRRPEVWRGVARRLAEWHATLPVSAISAKPKHGPGTAAPTPQSGTQITDANDITPDKLTPNIWTVMQRWLLALPNGTEAEQKRRASLQEELIWMVKQLDPTPSSSSSSSSSTSTSSLPFVFAHCDLLCGNVIIQPQPGSGYPPSPSQTSSRSSPAPSTASTPDPLAVSFIDYEDATPAPAAFDIANHFAEWGGFDCDFAVLPTRAQRRDFLATYLAAFNQYSAADAPPVGLDDLMALVDAFRGAPGFYWGIWALIQAQISQIDFDYASYAEVRLSEYWAWKEALGGKVGEKPLRERRWAQEE